MWTPKEQSWLYVCLSNVIKLIRASFIFAKLLKHSAITLKNSHKQYVLLCIFYIWYIFYVSKLWSQYICRIPFSFFITFLLFLTEIYGNLCTLTMKRVVSDLLFLNNVEVIYYFTGHIKIWVKQCCQKIVYNNISYIQ